MATDLLNRFGHDLSKVAVVFPNKRASLFLNAELAKQSAERGMDAIWAPSYITISELFRKHTDLVVADQIELVCRLYDVYSRVTGFAEESIDHFYNWGVLLLADFDDIDKNMADTDKLFKIVTELHELDDVTYIEDEQKKILKRFFQNFTDNHQSKLQEKFIHLWSKLHEIYTTFREELRNDHLAYEGMLYRDVIEQEDIDFEYDTYCFVAFNMLQKVEQKLFTRLKNAEPKDAAGNPRALFYWDYDTYYLNKQHEAGHFIGEYLSQFPDALEGIDHSNFIKNKANGKKKEPDISFISAPTEHIQARYVHDWLLENERYKDGARTAIVMCDEHLLQTIIRSLPEEVEKVNITTGYPLSQSPIVSFVQQLIELQRTGIIRGTDKYRIRYVNSVLNHPYALHVSAEATSLFKDLSKKQQFYPSRSELSTDENLALLFKDPCSMQLIGHESLSFNTQLILWLQDVIKVISHAESLDALAKESLFRTYQVLQRLFTLTEKGILRVETGTFCRLLMQIINSTTVPYHGEPIEGIQIMGVLETRCLDFEHILVLSCNEGNMPKSVNDASFIPHSVRRAYGLTTVENKVGIYSYYFHRLIQRCKDVSISYNSSADLSKSGEMSRFMLQLMVEGGAAGMNICRKTLHTENGTNTYMPKTIEKDEVVKKHLNLMIEQGRYISPSSLGKYLRCPVQYYYMYVAGLFDNKEEDPDSMDNAVFGTIFHKAAENAYEELSRKDNANAKSTYKGRVKWHISREAIEHALKDPTFTERCVDKAFKQELFHNDSKGEDAYTPDYTGLQLINKRVLIRLLHDLLMFDLKSAPFVILGQEIFVGTEIDIIVDGQPKRIKVGGTIDRLDMVGNEQTGYRIRVIDYKTGNYKMESLPDVSDIFKSENISKHADYFLQAMLYSYIVRNSKDDNPNGYPVSPELLFVQKARSKDYSPMLEIGNEKITDVQVYKDDFEKGLSALISDIHNKDIPFTPCGKKTQCDNCSFKHLCGM